MSDISSNELTKPPISHRSSALERKGEKAAEKDFKVVSIGASAGGLDACQRLLDGLPASPGMAFLLVQHLDPAQESLLAPLLGPHTTMKVVEAVDGACIEPNTLHVIQPGTYLAVHDGKLSVSIPNVRHGARMPFDFLLQSVAKEYASRALCVILSGTGADGSAGLKAISAGGGVVIAQDPTEAAFSGMPTSAIATGLTNFVLPISSIVNVLIASTREEKPNKTMQKSEQTVAEGISAIIDFLRTDAGQDFTPYKRGTLERRIERRIGMAPANFGNPQSYLSYIRQNIAERETLCGDLLIHITRFFRDSAAFEHLASKIIPEIVRAAAPERPVRVWVAGCSSGEEAYSLAILFSQAIEAAGSRSKLQIFASDSDPDSITLAREGFYLSSIESDLSKDQLARYFSVEDGGYRVLTHLRETVVFTVQDVLSDPPFSRLDFLSCRNLLIYLGPDAQKRAIALFHFALNEGGVLFLGSAETAGAIDGRFQIIDKAHRIYRNIARNRPGSIAFSAGASSAIAALQHPGTEQIKRRRTGLGEIGRQMAFDAHGPPTVIINTRHECLYTMGPFERYLSMAQGKPTTDLFMLAHPDIQIKLRVAVQQAMQRGQAVVLPTDRCQNSDTAPCDIHVTPFSYDGEELLLICFVDRPDRLSVYPLSPQEDIARVAELEKELDQTRQEFRDAIQNLEESSEEQKAANDETLSVNEEYQSTNEELLTSKEELQSLNEELTALNAQLQETLEHQRMTSNDLQNVLNSTDVATIFLDQDLNIRFYTPATKLLFSIIPGDIGRPLANLASLATDGALLEDAIKVLKSSSPIEVEISGKDGLWFLRRILPYRGQDGSVEGVVITFANITAQRHSADALIVARREAESANRAKSRFLAAASHDLRQPLQTLTLVQGLLARSPAAEKQQQLIGRFNETLCAMTGMLNALLDINQIDAGIVHKNIVDFSLNDLLVKIEGEFAYLAEGKGINLRSVATRQFIRSDPHLLDQMIRNIVSNALKYTMKGKVLIGCRRHDKSVSIEIWDTGIGISDDELKMIFDEYHQIDNAARETSKGLGLGLPIVKRLSELLGHKVRVRSMPGKGSMFAIDVPIAPTAHSYPSLACTSPEAAFPEIPGAILIVEDDLPVREMLVDFLREAGHHVMSAADDGTALDLAVHGALRPDLILADYNLSCGMDGVVLTSTLRKNLHADIPVIILTGDISAETLQTIVQNRFLWLHKPVGATQLLSMIHGLLTQQQLLPPLAVQPHDESMELCAATIHIVDDDANVLTTLRRVFEGDGYAVETYDSSEEFLQSRKRHTPECLLVDAYLPGMSGLELIENLKERGDNIASIMITGRSDVTIAVRAMKAGVSDFLEKPVGLTELHASVLKALGVGMDESRIAASHASAVALISQLTPRQHQVMDLVLAGHPSKNIAEDLGINQRTVEHHRAAIMLKTGMRSLPALARLAMTATNAV